MVAYQLELPATSRIHPIFHVSLLKPTLPSATNPQPLPLILSNDFELLVELMDLLKLRYTPDGDPEVLVQWRGLPPCDNSWELVDKLLHTFPGHHLEDKVKDLGGSIDRGLLIKRVFVRRGQEANELSQGNNEA